MRIVACLAAIACAGAPVFGQVMIEWSSARPLVRDDFKGRAPANAAVASLSWLDVDVSWACERGELVASARATFDPSRSWWRAAQGSIWPGAGERTSGVSQTHLEARRSVMQRDSQLLEHEQLHFDLAEIAARKIRRKFAETKDACAEPGRTDAFHGFIADVDREMQEEQQRYDRETAHGINAAAQDRWKRRIQQQLDRP